MKNFSELQKSLLVIGGLFLLFCWYIEMSPFEAIVDLIQSMVSEINEDLKNPIIIGIVLWLIVKKDILAAIRGEPEKTDS